MDLKIIIGVVLIVLCVGLILFFGLIQRNRGSLRPIQAFSRLQRALGLAVEEGKRLHISIGKSGINQSQGAAGLIALSTLERVAQQSIVSDQPPIATSGDAQLAILSQDTLKSAYRSNNALEQHDADRGRLTGITPFSYIAGALPLARDENISAHILIGNFGPEIALVNEAAERENAFTLAATDSLPTQAVFYATAQEPLIGEELYAVPAYLKANPFHLASLRAQDVLRWVIIGLILVGGLLKILGISIL